MVAAPLPWPFQPSLSGIWGPRGALFWASSLPVGREKMDEVIIRFSGPRLSSDPVAR